MSSLLKRFIQSVVVLIAVVAITSVSIDATDSFRSSQSALGILATYMTTEGCGEGTVELLVDGTTLCVDQYEAGVGKECVIAEPASSVDTATNANDADCKPISAPHVMPWRFVTEVQAEQLCARAGKRLLTAAEWYVGARGTADSPQSCVVASTLQVTGSNAQCTSGIGAFDMVGNVWELVSDAVTDGAVGATPLPLQGYIEGVGSDGLPQKTTEVPNGIYNNDYFWREASGTYALMRGGYYGSGADGGIYSVHAGVEQNFASAAVGFRCVAARL